MSDVIIFDRMQQRRGTTANLASVNEVLRDGEFCVETSTGKFKIGDGVTGWNSLAYQGVWTLADVRRVLDLLGSTATGDVIYKGASGWTRLAAGTNGHVLTLASGIPSWAAGGGGGGAMTYVGNATLGSSATTLAVSGLDLTSDTCYFVVMKINVATATAGSIRLFYNADTTTTNYYTHRINANSTTLSAARSNTAELCATDQTEYMTYIGHIAKDPEGRARFTGKGNRRGTSILMEERTHLWNTTTNPTGFTLSHTVASGLGTGTSIDVWKVDT